MADAEVVKVPEGDIKTGATATGRVRGAYNPLYGLGRSIKTAEVGNADPNRDLTPAAIRGTLDKRGVLMQAVRTNPALAAAWNDFHAEMSGCRWTIGANGNSDEALEQAEFWREMLLDGMETLWDNFVASALEAVVNGFAPFEWTVRPDVWRGKQVFVIDQIHYIGPQRVHSWVVDGQNNVVGAVVAKDTATGFGQEFVVVDGPSWLNFVFMPDGDSPVGNSAVRAAYFADQGWKAVHERALALVKRLAFPIPYATQGSDATYDKDSDEHAAVMTFLQDIQNDGACAAILPEGIKIDFLKVDVEGPKHAMELAAVYERHMQKLLGAYSHSVGENGQGAYNLADDKTLRGQKFVKFIARWLATKFRAAVMWPLHEWTFGKGSAPPELVPVGVLPEKRIDPNAEARISAILAEGGSRDFIEARLRILHPDIDDRELARILKTIPEDAPRNIPRDFQTAVLDIIARMDAGTLDPEVGEILLSRLGMDDDGVEAICKAAEKAGAEAQRKAKEQAAKMAEQPESKGEDPEVEGEDGEAEGEQPAPPAAPPKPPVIMASAALPERKPCAKCNVLALAAAMSPASSPYMPDVEYTDAERRVGVVRHLMLADRMAIADIVGRAVDTRVRAAMQPVLDRNRGVLEGGGPADMDMLALELADAVRSIRADIADELERIVAAGRQEMRREIAKANGADDDLPPLDAGERETGDGFGWVVAALVIQAIVDRVNRVANTESIARAGGGARTRSGMQIEAELANAYMDAGADAVVRDHGRKLYGDGRTDFLEEYEATVGKPVRVQRSIALEGRPNPRLSSDICDVCLPTDKVIAYVGDATYTAIGAAQTNGCESTWSGTNLCCCIWVYAPDDEPPPIQ